MEVIIFLIWIVLLVMNGMIAKEKNRDCVGVFLTGLFLSPLTAYLYLLAVPALPATNKKNITEDDEDDD